MSAGRQGGGGATPRGVRWLRRVAVALLVAAAGLTLFGLPELREAVAEGRWPRTALAVPPVVLALFVAGFAVYRLALVRAGRYPAGKALVQIGVVLLVAAVITGIAVAPPDRPFAPAAPVDLSRALRSRDAAARAMAAELVRYRPREVALPLAGRLVDLLADPSMEVRRQAHGSLVALAGRDVGAEAPDVAARWREHFREAGAFRK